MKRYPTYKDSGIKWIGEIPSHWEVRRLFQAASEYFVSNKYIHHKNLLSLSYGNIIRKDVDTTKGLLPSSFDGYQVVKNGIIVLRLTDLQNDHKSLRVGLAREEGIVTSAYLSIKPKELTTSEYLYEQLHCNDIHKVFYGMGDGLRQSLNWQGMKNLPIVIPPLSEQRAIVSFLDSELEKIDTYVEKEKQLIERLKELKQSVIARAVTRGINPDAKMKPSGISWIGEIPQHWKVSKVRSLFRERREKVSDKEWQALSVAKDGILPQLETAVKTDNGDNRKKVCVGDFVVNSRSDRKGSCGFSDYNGSVSLINIVLKPINVIGQFYHYLFRSNDYIEEFYKNGRGIVSDLWTTRYSEMRNIYIPVPPAAEQQKIVDYITAATTKIDRLIVEKTYEIEHIKELRQRLIADAVTGKIDVREPLNKKVAAAATDRE